MDTTVLPTNLSQELQQLRSELNTLKTDSASNNDAFFNCTMAIIIFLMQAGFALLEAGAVRSKNCTNIMFQNLMDSLLSMVGYSAIGWALAYGANLNPLLDSFFGFSEFLLIGTTNFSKFFFQFVFAAAAATIVTGAVAERAQLALYFTYSIFISSFVYPVLTHWGWAPNGWMLRGFEVDSTFRTTYIDFSGSGIVHVCAGTISLIAAYMIGPRIGRFSANEDSNSNNGTVLTTSTKTSSVSSTASGKQSLKSDPIKGHSLPFVAFGGLILMCCFLAFNGGAVGEISSTGIGQTMAKVMINTVICGAFGALSYLSVHRLRKGNWSVLFTMNACLTGMVSACAGCNQMQPWASVVVGTVSGMSYLLFSEISLRLRVDDPLDAFAVHFGGGFWGVIAASLFTDKGMVYAFIGGAPGGEVELANAFWQLGWQMSCLLAIILWSSLTILPPFMLLKKFNKMRVSREVEIRGLDISVHGEEAYP